MNNTMELKDWEILTQTNNKLYSKTVKMGYYINNGVLGPFPLPVESTADIRSVHSAETLISMR